MAEHAPVTKAAPHAAGIPALAAIPPPPGSIPAAPAYIDLTQENEEEGETRGQRASQESCIYVGGYEAPAPVGGSSSSPIPILERTPSVDGGGESTIHHNMADPGTGNIEYHSGSHGLPTGFALEESPFMSAAAAHPTIHHDLTGTGTHNIEYGLEFHDLPTVFPPEESLAMSANAANYGIDCDLTGAGTSGNREYGSGPYHIPNLRPASDVYGLRESSAMEGGVACPSLYRDMSGTDTSGNFEYGSGARSLTSLRPASTVYAPREGSATGSGATHFSASRDGTGTGTSSFDPGFNDIQTVDPASIMYTFGANSTTGAGAARPSVDRYTTGTGPSDNEHGSNVGRPPTVWRTSTPVWLDQENLTPEANGIGYKMVDEINPYEPMVVYPVEKNLPFAPRNADTLLPFKSETGTLAINVKGRYVGAIGMLYMRATFVMARQPLTSPAKVTRLSGWGLSKCSLLFSEADMDATYTICLRRRDWPMGNVAWFPRTGDAGKVIEQMQEAFGTMDGNNEIFRFQPCVVRKRDGTFLGTGVKVLRGYEGYDGPVGDDVLEEYFKCNSGEIPHDEGGARALMDWMWTLGEPLPVYSVPRRIPVNSIRDGGSSASLVQAGGSTTARNATPTIARDVTPDFYNATPRANRVIPRPSNEIPSSPTKKRTLSTAEDGTNDKNEGSSRKKRKKTGKGKEKAVTDDDDSDSDDGQYTGKRGVPLRTAASTRARRQPPRTKEDFTKLYFSPAQAKDDDMEEDW